MLFPKISTTTPINYINIFVSINSLSTNNVLLSQKTKIELQSTKIHFYMGSLAFIIVFTLVAVAGTNIGIEARNLKLEDETIVPSQDFQMLPKGPVPPSGPSPDRPGFPPETSSLGLPDVSATPYHIMPKGDHHPPSGPSHGLTPDPPLPGPPPTRNYP